MTSLLALSVLACGSERWAQKTLADLPWMAPPIDCVSVRDGGCLVPVASIAKLGTIVPPNWASDLPRQPAEHYSVAVDGVVLGFKLESDDDFHVVIGDADGNTLIAEMPAPECGPPWAASMFAKARSDFVNLVHMSPVRAYHLTLQPVAVHVVGVLFFDKPHGQLGMAPNGLEIHPVLSIVRSKP